jgi:hypothetical protein
MTGSRKPSKEESAAESTETRSPIQEYLAEIGRKGGLKGGIARKKSLSKKRRKEIAQKAAEARWSSAKDKN